MITPIESLRCDIGGCVAFLHIHAASNGLKIARSQIKIIRESGLFDKLSFLAISIAGDIRVSDVNTLLNLGPDHKIHIVSCEKIETVCEFPTLVKLHEFSIMNPGVKVLYLHTKGTRKYGGNIRIKQANWRRMAMHFLAERHDDCFDLLERYLAVGINLRWTGSIPIHFSGNFWWAWTDHLSTLFDLSKITWSIGTRFFCEYWVCSKGFERVCSIHNSNVNHYYEFYPMEKYVHSDISEYVLKKNRVINVRQ